MDKAIYESDPSNYYVVLRWMISELHLSGLKLSVFAIVHGFTQNGSLYDGSLDWIASFLESSPSQISRTLKELTDLNYLSKEIITEKENRLSGGSYKAAGFIHYCKYRSNIKFVDGKVIYVNTKNTIEKNAMAIKKNTNTIEENTMVEPDKIITVEKNAMATVEKNAMATVEKNTSNNIYNNKFKNKAVVNQKHEPLRQNTDSEKLTTAEIYILLKKLFNTDELMFSEDFYQNLHNAMISANLPASSTGSYLKWAYEYSNSHCKDSNVADYFYKFASQKYAFVKFNAISSKNDTHNKALNIKFICPVCQLESNIYDNNDCPRCGIPANKRSDSNSINLYQKIFKLPVTVRTNLNSEINEYFKKNVMFNISAKTSFEFENYKISVYKKYGVL